jgi:hypothetical protein
MLRQVLKDSIYTIIEVIGQLPDITLTYSRNERLEARGYYFVHDLFFRKTYSVGWFKDITA